MGPRPYRGENPAPLIRPSVRTGAPDPIPSGLRPSPLDKGSRPPVGGRRGARSNREEFGPLWDVWIHILGIGAECACWRAGGPVCRPYGGNVVSPGGAPCRVVCGRRAGEDTRPYGDCGRKTAGAQCAPLHRIYERLYIQKEGQVWDLSLKMQRRSGASQKVLLVPFLSRKGTAYFLFQRK